MYLLDTDVIWALRGHDPARADEPLFEWVASQMPSTLFASAITMIEFENGTRQLERKDKPAAVAIQKWIETRLRPAFDGRIIATRNARNFRAGKVKTLDPWAYAPEADDLDWRRASRSAPIWLKSLFVR